jgi:hypothetical protein
MIACRHIIASTAAVIAFAGQSAAASAPEPAGPIPLRELTAQTDVAFVGRAPKSVVVRTDRLDTVSESVRSVPKVELAVFSVVKGTAVREQTTVETQATVSMEKGDLVFVIRRGRPLGFFATKIVSVTAVRYLKQLQRFANDEAKCREIIVRAFEGPDSIIAEDAALELNRIPLRELRLLTPHMSRQCILARLKDPAIPQARKAAYFRVLGLCGSREDAAWVEGILRSAEDELCCHMIQCYLLLRGSEGLAVIEELFLDKKASSHRSKSATDRRVFTVRLALQLLGEQDDAIPRRELRRVLYRILDFPSSADGALVCLARWGDWTQVDRAVSLFHQSQDYYLRRNIAVYLMMCPQAEARSHWAELEKVDPKAVEDAKRFHPKGFQ